MQKAPGQARHNCSNASAENLVLSNPQEAFPANAKSISAFSATEVMTEYHSVDAEFSPYRLLWTELLCGLRGLVPWLQYHLILACLANVALTERGLKWKVHV